MNPRFDIQGRRILLTGGGRGIGASLAAALVEGGAKVGVFDLHTPSSPVDGVDYFKIDLVDENEVDLGFQKFLDKYGEIDVLINNAGITIPASGDQYSLDDWQKTLRVNLTAAFQLCQLAGKQMIVQGAGGSIINVTSIGAMQGFSNNPAYGSSKGGLRQLTKALANEWGRYGIRVNNLVPGYARTPMNQKSWDDEELRAKRAECTLLGRWAEPDDFIGPVVFLVSDASRYVTGTDLVVDGGWLAKGM